MGSLGKALTLLHRLTLMPFLSPPTTQRPNDLLPWRKTLIVGSVMCAVAVSAGLLFYPAQNRSSVLLLFGAPALVRLALVFLLAAGIPLLNQRNLPWMAPAALVLSLLDLWTFGFGYNLIGSISALKLPDRFTKALKETVREGRVLTFYDTWPLREPPHAYLPPNLSVLAGVKEIGGYEGAYFLSYKQQVNRWVGKDASPPTNGNMVMFPPDGVVLSDTDILKAGAVQAIVSPWDVLEGVVPTLSLAAWNDEHTWEIIRNSPSPSRAAFFPHWPPSPDEDGSRLPITESPGDPNRVEIALSKEQPGYVLLRDTMADGWQAEVDGKAVQPVRNPSVIQRVIPVGAQNRRVVWEYRPPALALGWRLMGVGWVGVLLCWAFGLFASARPRRER
jgi:hypothetical protein